MPMECKPFLQTDSLSRHSEWKSISYAQGKVIFTLDFKIGPSTGIRHSFNCSKSCGNTFMRLVFSQYFSLIPVHSCWFSKQKVWFTEILDFSKFPIFRTSPFWRVQLTKRADVSILMILSVDHHNALRKHNQSWSAQLGPLDSKLLVILITFIKSFCNSQLLQEIFT